MPRRHRIIRKIEGRKRYEKRAKLIITASVLIVLLSFPLAVYKARFNLGIDTLEMMDRIQIARNYAKGEGITTNYIIPGAYVNIRRGINPPDFAYAPMYTWLMGHLPSVAKGTVLTPPDASIIKMASFFFFITAILLYFMGRAFCDIRTGFLAALFFIFNTTILHETATGAWTPFAAFMLTLFFLLVYLMQDQSFVISLMAGVLLGFCYLTNYALLVMIVPLAIFIMGSNISGRYRHLAAMIMGCAIVAAPWMVRNAFLGGNALCGQSFSASFLSYPFPGGLRDAPALKKFFLQSKNVYATILKTGGGLVFAFALVSVIVRFENSQLQKLKGVFWASFGLVFIVTSMGSGKPEILIAFIPVSTLLGIKAFIDLNARYSLHSEKLRVRLFALFVALNIAPYMLLIFWGGVFPSSAISRDRLKVMADMQGLIFPGDVIMTNAPEALAYYGQFNTLPIPKSRKELAEWQRYFGKIRFAAICPYGVSGILEWRALAEKKVPEWFIADQAYSYPDEELFFAADGVGAPETEKEWSLGKESL